MFYYLLIVLILSNINCIIRLPGNVSTDYYFTTFMNANNELMYFEPEEKSLYVFPRTLSPSEYEKTQKMTTTTFNRNNIPQTVYLNIRYLNAASVEVSFFDEEHLTTYTFEKDSSIYDHISVRPLFDGFSFYVFSNAKNNSEHRNTLEIVEFDLATKRTTTRFTYRFTSEADRVNCYCMATTDSDIFCGMIEKTENATHALYNQYIFLLDEDDGSDMGKELIDSSTELIDEKKGTEYLNILKNKLFVLISLETEKILYCYVNSGVYCGLARVRRRRLEIVVEKEKIFDDFTFQSNLVSDSISLRQKGNEYILSVIDGEKVRFASISVFANNRILVNYRTDQIFMKSNSPYFAKLFLDKENKMLISLAYKEKGETHAYIADLEYSTCIDTNVNVYNAEKKLLTFDITPNILEVSRKYDIVFLNDGKPINSLLYIEDEVIVESRRYDIGENIYFNLSAKDYDDTKNKGVYELEFTNSKTMDSQVCKLTVNIKKCEDKCEYCTATKCWDKDWTLIEEKEDDKDKNDTDSDKPNDKDKNDTDSDKPNDKDKNDTDSDKPNDKDKNDTDSDKPNDKDKNDTNDTSSDKDDGKKKENGKKNKNKLKGYQIALIVIGAVLVVALIVGLILYFKFRSKKQKENEPDVEAQVDNEPLTS